MLLRLPLAIAIFMYIWKQCYALQRCRNRTSAYYRPRVYIHYEEILRGPVDDIKLYARVNWTVHEVPDEAYDGFLVRLVQAKTYDSIQPIDDCEASSTQVWIKTKDCMRRENTTGDRCHDDLEQGGSFCPCDKDNCSALERFPCSGTPSMMKKHKLYGYLSIPNTRRSIQYPIEFNTAYNFQILLYHKQFYSTDTPHSLPRNWFCADQVAHMYGLSLPEASQKCCMANSPAITPFDLKREELVLDKATKTLNVTFSWIPPTINKYLYSVYPVVRLMSRPPSHNEEISYTPLVTDLETVGVVDGNETCAVDTRRQKATAYNLLPNLHYVLQVVPTYDGKFKFACEHAKCSSRLRMETNMDPCDSKWTRCTTGFDCVVIENEEGNPRVPETKCVPGGALYTSNSSETVQGAIGRPTEVTHHVPNTEIGFNYSQAVTDEIQGSCNREYCHKYAVCVPQTGTSNPSCSCPEGLVGNGINESFGGTGCSGCPLIKSCDTMASCVPRDSPSGGFICRCDDAYYGDGLKSGSGCRSRARRIATIVVPVVLCGILLLITVILCLCRGRRRKFHRSDNIRL